MNAKYETRQVTRDDLKKLVSGVVFLEVTVRTGGSLRAPADPTEIGADEEQADALSLLKDLIDQNELKKIRSLRNSFKAWLVAQAVHAPAITRPGMLMIPVGRIDAIEKKIAEFVSAMMFEVDTDLIPRYPEMKATQERKLGKLYREADYKSEQQFRDSFGISYRWLVFDTPDALSAVSKELYEKERERLEKQWQEAWPEVRDALREGFAKLVKRMADAMQPDEQGKYGSLKEPLLDLFRDFLTTFNDRNVTNDEELATLVTQAKQILGNATAKRLRSFEGLRDRISTDFGRIADGSAKLRTNGARRISLAGDAL